MQPDSYGGRMLIASLIIFNMIIVIIAIFFGIALWKGANAKRPAQTADGNAENSVSKERLNSS
jgi:uncharacterized membrane protein